MAVCNQCGEQEAAPRRKLCYRCKAANYRATHDRRTYDQDARLRLKQEVIDMYGGECACCGETELVFLTFDHVDGNGGGRERIMGGKQQLYWLRRERRQNIQVLCFNCNFAEHWGGCPHQRSGDKSVA